MDKGDNALDRLLRAAAATPEETPEPPFGFEARVLAQWRARHCEAGMDFWQYARIFRRVAVGAAMVTALASAGAFWQFQQNNDFDEPTNSAYAIADSAIEAGAW